MVNCFTRSSAHITALDIGLGIAGFASADEVHFTGLGDIRK